MLTSKNLTNEQIATANDLIAELSNSRFESMVYQVEVYLQEVHAINFSNDYDALSFCERLGLSDIPHALRVINLKLKCYE